MNRAIKYRIYPNDEQKVLFAKTFGCCRKIYNLMLSDKIKSYKETKTFGKQTPAQYKTAYPYLKEVDSLALSNVQMNLQQAMTNCFNETRKKKNGFPVFKSAKRSRKSYTTNNQKNLVRIVDNKYIRLPKVGEVKAVIHQTPKEDWKLKSATISQDSDGKYYVSVLFEYNTEITPVEISDKAVGLDYKSDGLYMDSNGYCPHGHKCFRENQKKLARWKRKLKHKKVGSNNYKKQQLKVSKIYKHTANQRLDFLHKESTKIINLYDVICVETLDMSAIANKKFHNGKATLDNGYGMFLSMLEYKAKDCGKHFIKVDKWYASSQICSHCGSKQKLSLNERTYKCDCGLEIDRDLNAAINIKNEGLRLLKAS